MMTPDFVKILFKKFPIAWAFGAGRATQSWKQMCGSRGAQSDRFAGSPEVTPQSSHISVPETWWEEHML